MADTVNGETFYLVEDIQSTAKIDFPTVVQMDEPVVFRFEVVGEIDAARSQVIRYAVEDVDDIRAVLVVIGCGEMDLQTFRIINALADRIDELD